VLAVLSVTIFSRLLGQLGVAVTSRMRETRLELRALVLRALAAAAVLGLAGGLAVAAWGSVNDDVGLTVAAIAAAGLFPNVVWQTVSGVLLGQARIRLWNYVQVLPPALTLVGMLVLVVGLDGEVEAAVLAWTIAHVLTAAFALGAARDLWLPPLRPRADAHAVTLVRLALVMGAVQVVNLVSYRAELFVLQRYDGLAEVGIYSIAMQAAEALWLIPAAIATAVTAPAVHESEAGAARLIRRSVAKALAYTSAAAVAVGLIAPLAIPLIFGDAFRPAWRALALLLPGVVAYAPVTILVVYLSVRHAKPRLSLSVAVAGMVVTLAAALITIPRWGGEGAAVASTIGYGVGGLLAWLLFERTARLAVRSVGP
jgi:O-antigen/teichoic acid export membrane protein